MMAGETLNSFLRDGFSNFGGWGDTQFHPTGWSLKILLRAEVINQNVREP